MNRTWWRTPLLTLVCGALTLSGLLCQVSSRDDRALLHAVAPIAVPAILGGLAYTIFVKTWDRWVALAFTLGAGFSFVPFYFHVGW